MPSRIHQVGVHAARIGGPLDFWDGARLLEQQFCPCPIVRHRIGCPYIREVHRPGGWGGLREPRLRLGQQRLGPHRIARHKVIQRPAKPQQALPNRGFRVVRGLHERLERRLELPRHRPCPGHGQPAFRAAWRLAERIPAQHGTRIKVHQHLVLKQFGQVFEEANAFERGATPTRLEPLRFTLDHLADRLKLVFEELLGGQRVQAIPVLERLHKPKFRQACRPSIRRTRGQVRQGRQEQHFTPLARLQAFAHTLPERVLRGHLAGQCRHVQRQRPAPRALPGFARVTVPKQVRGLVCREGQMACGEVNQAAFAARPQQFRAVQRAAAGQQEQTRHVLEKRPQRHHDFRVLLEVFENHGGFHT